ncbi:family 43 glycosylhydrolase [Bacillus sp. FSL K6-3431]|uniref:family 43 glycosylhydrolase n=1 Tax=Bacillus sp. FSL K6-3431 TaxID=2921500 RepID=UPI0030F73761
MLYKQLSAITAICLLLMIGSGCEHATEKEVNINMDKESSYANPFSELSNEWPDYGNGDPYILRHNGMYFLYVSTKDSRVGIKAWSSQDLVNWTYAGLVTEDERTTSAYAPEVVYWNGRFYMYTSPAGQGHYVLSSESPTGPFEVETENLGMSIDGSVFIDDDGSWYFTNAGDKGIVGHKMADPYTFDYGVNTNVFLGHWTEGSMIIKKNGHYYMTYTGNHVFSKGYRINYAVSDENPLEGYEVPEHNPIIISTRDDFNGLGHNSIVLGPNLDSYYAVYHNLIGRSTEGPPVRKMNIDRFVFNGKKMDVLGPTNFDVPIPERPVYEKRWSEDEEPILEDEKRWLSDEKTEAYYTAEYNLKINESTEKSQFAVLLSYEDENNFGSISINLEEKRIDLNQVRDGVEKVLGSGNYPNEFDFTKLHTLRVENKKTRTIVFLDGMNKIEVENTDFGRGEIGYEFENVEPALAYTAFSNHVDSSSDFEVYKPLPGTIEAVHYLEGENRGFYIKNPLEKEGYRSKVPIRLKENGAYSVSLMDKGDWLKYKVNAMETGMYEVSAVINPHSLKKDIAIGISIDDQKVDTFKVSKKEIDLETESLKVRLGKVKMEKGLHVLKLMLERGEVEVDHLEVYRVSDEEIDIPNGFSEVEEDDIHGSWMQKEEGVNSNSTEDMKMYVGDEKWTDLEVHSTFEINNEFMDDAGLLVRVTNESNFEHQVRDSLIGYYLSFNTREIALQKLNYDSTLLKAVSVSLEQGKEYQLRVLVQANELKVFLDDDKEPIISYKDPDALMYGKVGVRSVYSDVFFKNIAIKSLSR